jgi:hypothetical protein
MAFSARNLWVNPMRALRTTITMMAMVSDGSPMMPEIKGGGYEDQDHEVLELIQDIMNPGFSFSPSVRWANAGMFSLALVSN